MRTCPYCFADIDSAEWDAQQLLEVIQVVAARHSVTAAVILGEGRGSRTVSQARHEAIRELRDRFGFSMPELGRIFNRHHTTILNSLQQTEKDASHA